MHTRMTARLHAGFTLLEILITLVILSIGMLGVAGMQASALRNTHAAYTKTQATNLAMDMIERIRANPKGIDHYPGFDSGNAVPADPGCIANGCTPDQLAAYDKFEWSQPLNAATKPILPAGRGVIQKQGDEFIITILWQEIAYQDLIPNKCTGFDGEADDIACFQMRFKP